MTECGHLRNLVIPRTDYESLSNLGSVIRDGEQNEV